MVKNPSYIHGPDDELLLIAGLRAFREEKIREERQP